LDQSIAAHDAGVANQSRISKVNSNTYATSRITLSAVEDLGAGLKAGFFLETGLSPDAGTAGSVTGVSGTTGTNTFFSREANMYISDAKLGELRIGKITAAQTDSDVFVNATTSHVAGMNQALIGKQGGSGTQVAIDGLGDNANNTIAYTTPTFAGVQVQVFRAAGEDTAALNSNTVNGGSVRYTNGALKAVYSQANQRLLSNKDLIQRQYGLSYDFGFARLGAVQGTRDNTDTTTSDKDKVTVYSVAVPVPALPKVTLVGAYHTAKNDRGATWDGKATVYGATYDFSKRTAAYVTYASSKNESAGNYAVSGMTGTTAGADEKLTSVGIKHFF
jgi:predicted porin